MIATKKTFFKLKVAIVFGYNGLKFHGLQKNKDVVTIEEELERALFDSNLIAQHNFDNLKKSGWSRAARTDKGVHAIANIINCKIQITKDYVNEIYETDADNTNDKDNKDIKNENNMIDDGDNDEEESNVVDKIKHKQKVDMNKIIQTINSNLSQDIRVFAIKKVTRAFDVKRSARSRIYEYIAPMTIFTKKSLIDEEEEKLITDKLNLLINKFKGTHNFHNYTKKMKATDPKAKRYILDMKLEPFIVNTNKDVKFIKFTIHGQSFIYHQIRKMIGVLSQIIQSDYKNDFLDNTFFNNAVDIWLAPPQGLYLNRVLFDGYNKKNDIPEKLEYTQAEEDSMKQFKENIIYPVITKSELEEQAYKISIINFKLKANFQYVYRFSLWLEKAKSNQDLGDDNDNDNINEDQ